MTITLYKVFKVMALVYYICMTTGLLLLTAYILIEMSKHMEKRSNNIIMAFLAILVAMTAIPTMCNAVLLVQDLRSNKGLKET